MGGHYERLVAIVKNPFKMVVGRTILKLDEFNTLIAEIEAMVNSRPLTYVNSDPGCGVVLRPMDFLVDLSTGSQEVDPTTPLPKGDSAKMLLRHWKYKQQKLKLVWRQFYDDYLTSLREKQRLQHRNPRSTAKTKPKVGEVVLVKDEDVPRGHWKLGKIVRLIESRDGSVRAAQLLLPNRSVINRSVSHLFPLEIEHDPEETDHIPEQLQEDPEKLDYFNDEEIDVVPGRIQFFADLEDKQANATNVTMAITSSKWNLLSGLSVAGSWFQ